MPSNETDLSSLDLSESDEDEDDDDDVELSCFRRGGFCTVECELLVCLIREKIKLSTIVLLNEKSYLERLVDELFLLLPDESESRLTGTTWCLQ